jgi:hypothetical protein
VSNELTPNSHGFLIDFLEASDDHPAVHEIAKAIVSMRASGKSMTDVLTFYEIHSASLVKGIVEAMAHATHIKLARDSETHNLGSYTIDSIIRHVAAISVVLGAHLAKEHKL